MSRYTHVHTHIVLVHTQSYIVRNRRQLGSVVGPRTKGEGKRSAKTSAKRFSCARHGAQGVALGACEIASRRSRAPLRHLIRLGDAISPCCMHSTGTSLLSVPCHFPIMPDCSLWRSPRHSRPSCRLPPPCLFLVRLQAHPFSLIRAV